MGEKKERRRSGGGSKGSSSTSKSPKNDSASKKGKKKAQQGEEGRAGDEVTDARFSALSSDPRFQHIPKSEAKVKVGKRFAAMFTEPEFAGSFKVDRQAGKPKRRDDLSAFYELAEEDDEKEEEEDSDAVPQAAVQQEAESAEEMDSEEEGGGFRWSAESSSEEEEEEPEDFAVMEEEDEEEEIEDGDATSRLALVNLDWDQMTATDLFQLLSAFVPSGKKLKRVSILPSLYGLEQMAKEEREGPTDIWATGEGKYLSKTLTEAEREEYEQNQLRKYQLQRLKYYFAVVECDSVETASAIYRECDGLEVDITSNILDIRFIPEGTEFEDRQVPKDVATELPPNYKCVLAPTKALQHSKVELTWDADDPRRREMTRKNFSKEELIEMDFKAYLAESSSEESDSESEEENGEDGEKEKAKKSKRKRKKKEKRKNVRAKYKGLLQSIAGAEESNDNKWSGSSKDGRMEDMEITFTPGLGDTIAEVVDRVRSKKEKGGEEEEEEAPFDAYLRKREERQQEKRKRRKERKEREAEEDEDEDEEEMRRKRAELELLVTRKAGKTAESELPSGKRLSKKAKLRKKQEAKAKAEAEAKAASAKVLQDDRFAELFANPHEFELDPTNPNFKKTSADKDILMERRKRLEERSKEAGKKRPSSSSTSAKDLVASIKRKTAAAAEGQPKKKKQRRA